MFKNIKTAEDLAAEEAIKQRDLAKRQRADAVANLKVTTLAGNTFDGDEMSQTRMARAITAMSPEDTVPWVLANNSTIQATADELKEALKLAGAAQAEVWVL